MTSAQRNVLLIIVAIGLLELSFTGRVSHLLALATGKSAPLKDAPESPSRTGPKGSIKDLPGMGTLL